MSLTQNSTVLSDAQSIDIHTNGLRLHALVQGSGPLVVLVHGFPEFSHCWRHQLGPLARAGFKVCAIDVRGCGLSDCPYDVSDYSMRQFMGDIIGVIDHFDAKTATLIGHDWGAPIVYHTALDHADRVNAVAGLSIPYFHRASIPPLALWHKLYTEKNQFFYQVYFQDEGVAETAFEADPSEALAKMYYSLSGMAVSQGYRWPSLPVNAPLLNHLAIPNPLPDWLKPTDLSHCAATFAQTGFRGAFNRYRNIDRDYHECANYGASKVLQPSAFIAGSLDPIRHNVPGRDAFAAADALFDDMRQVTLIDGAGHWVQQEAPDQVTDALLGFLTLVDL